MAKCASKSVSVTLFDIPYWYFMLLTFGKVAHALAATLNTFCYPYLQETGASAAPASIKQVSPSTKKKVIEHSISQERLEHAKVCHVQQQRRRFGQQQYYCW